MDELYKHQKVALEKMHNGCVLNGVPGSGKSRTALAYFYTKVCGGQFSTGKLTPMKNPMNLYIITTAKKRDDNDWDKELKPFDMSVFDQFNKCKNKVIVDSWNNIHKYVDVYNAFFIFDEQRAVGNGLWAKSFVKIAKHNKWIMLSATPGDTWMDYCPLFVANGFYRNRSEFVKQHVVFNRFVTYPKVEKYLDVGRLVRLKELITVNMEFKNKTTVHHEDIMVTYDLKNYNFVLANRWNPYTNEPVKQVSELCSVLRKVINSDEGRINQVKNLIKTHPRCIIFYNFDYELEILRHVGKDLNIIVAEWNGHKHDPVPVNGSWIYLVQYSAGSEGWNCTTTNTIIFYSQSYSYKAMTQAAGRIDRLNTPFDDLYYFHLKCGASIDRAISKCLSQKRDFNEKSFLNGTD